MKANRRHVETDVLIIGGGSAGCLAAQRVRELNPKLRVMIFEKGQIQYSGSIARGMDALNIVAVPGVSTPELYVESSSIACGKILDEPASYTMAARSFDLLKKLESWGVMFPKDAQGQYQMLQVHPKEKFLVAMKEPNLKVIVAQRALERGAVVMDRTMGVELLMDKGRVAGALGLNTRTGDLVACRAKAVILGNGGVSRFGLPNSGYLYGTFDYPGNTGDGYIMGFRAGAELTGFEHTVQAYLIKDINCPLLYITMTRGAKLIDGFGQVMKDDHVNMGELLMRHHQGKGPFSIRMRHLTEETIRGIEDILFSTERPVQERFFKGRGIDFRRTDVELHPTEFFLCGGHGMTGLVVNDRAETTVPGLFAAGDVSCVPRGHLTGAFVFGEIAAESAAGYAARTTASSPDEPWIDAWEEQNLRPLDASSQTVPVVELEYKVRRMIDDYVVPPKNEYKLTQGLHWMRTLREDLPRVAAVTNAHELSKYFEIRNIIDCGLLSARAGLERKESRWGYFHYRTDYPEVDDSRWIKHVMLSRGDAEGEISVRFKGIARLGRDGGGIMNNIRIDRDKCTFCGKCVDTCIMDNLCLQVAPCQTACPLHQNAHGYVQLIARGKYRQAYEEVRKTLPFPALVCRICSHPCETACARTTLDDAVAIRDLKHFLAEACDNVPFSPPACETGKKIAVVGSGPAGMLAAYDLRTAGHDVTILEAAALPGGMLSRAIPDYRLPPEVVAAAFDRLSEIGVTVSCNTRVGTPGEIGLPKLMEAYDAVLLAFGAQESLRLRVPGEGLPKVTSGLAFLEAVKAGSAPAVGRTVVVIGGGNTAIDSGRTARRLGAEEVRVIVLEAPGEMPALAWDVSEARHESLLFEHCLGISEIQPKGPRLSLSLVRCLSVFSPSGEFAPCFDEGDCRTIEADTVIVAIGQKVDMTAVPPLLTPNDRLTVDPLTLQTHYRKVFAAGDMVQGTSSAIEAMAQGRQAAISIDRFLRGEDLAWGRGFFDTSIERYVPASPRGERIRRVPHATRLCKRPSDFSPIDAPYTEEQAQREAGRCLSCGVPYGKYQTCWYCLPCEIECPEKALTVDLPYLVR